MRPIFFCTICLVAAVLLDIMCAEEHLFLILEKQPWIPMAKECHKNFSGHLVGYRDPRLQNYDLNSCVNNAQFWTGTYKALKPKRTSWLSFRGCYNTSALFHASSTPLNVARVYDCYEACSRRLRFAVNKQTCVCLSDTHFDVKEHEISISNCEIDLDGNLYGSSNSSAAIYEAVNVHINETSNCATFSSVNCSVRIYQESESCSRVTNSTNFCQNGKILQSAEMSWIEEQRWCLSRGSYLYPFPKTCISNKTTLSNLRRYQQIQDLNLNTRYISDQISFCQTLQFPDISIYRNCMDITQRFAGLCVSHIISHRSLLKSQRFKRIRICRKRTVENTSFQNPYTNGLTRGATALATKLTEATTGNQIKHKTSITENQECTTSSNFSNFSNMERKENEHSGTDNTGLTVGITVTVIIVVAGVVAVLIVLRRRMNKNGNKNSSSTHARTEPVKSHLYMVSTRRHQSMHNHRYEVPNASIKGELNPNYTKETKFVEESTLSNEHNYHILNPNNTKEHKFVEESASNEHNYHVLEMIPTKKEDNISEDVYYMSGDSVYDELNKRRPKRGIQQNEYGTMHDDGFDDYTYDETKQTRSLKIDGEDNYHIANNYSSDDNVGDYDVSKIGTRDQTTPYDTV